MAKAPMNSQIPHIPTGPDIPTPQQTSSEVEDHMPLVYAHYLMLKRIRFWGLFLFGLGIFHVFISGFLNVPWEMMLVIVGLASMVFKSSAMFIVFTFTLVWSLVPNISSYHPFWMMIGFGQLYFVMRSLKDFRKFAPMEKVFYQVNLQMIEEDKVVLNRSVRWLPRLGFYFGLSSGICTIILFVASLIHMASELTIGGTPGWFPYLDSLIINLAGLGFAASIASLISAFPKKWMSILGLITSLVSILIQLTLFL